MLARHVYPSSRKPRPMAMDECVPTLVGRCCPTWALWEVPRTNPMGLHELPSRALSYDPSPRGDRSLPQDEYFRFVKPGLKQHLGLLKLDVIYHRGQGDYLYCTDSTGKEVEVLDLVGGFGACLLGHNHPDIVSALSERLRSSRPFLSQGSNQAESGRLAARLSDQLSRTTGKSYVVTFGSSGTEAVEIAMKHSELERTVKIQTILERFHENLDALKNLCRKGECSFEARGFLEAGSLPRNGELASFEDFLCFVENHNRRVWERPPLFLALKGSFHGKTTGSLSLTYNSAYREPFTALLQDTAFLDPSDPTGIERAFEASLEPYYDLTLE